MPDFRWFPLNDKKVLMRYTGSDANVTIPQDINVVGWMSFMHCRFLKSVVIPEGVTKISLSAFRDCTSLTSVVFSDPLTEISDNAFDGCPNLTIYAPEGSAAENFAKLNRIPFQARQVGEG